MKTAPDDIHPHPDFQSQADVPPGGPDLPPPSDAPEIVPEPGYPGVTPDPQREIEPASPGGAQVEQPSSAPEITPIEPTGIEPLP